jgi:hypothetical protein
MLLACFRDVPCACPIRETFPSPQFYLTECAYPDQGAETEVLCCISFNSLWPIPDLIRECGGTEQVLAVLQKHAEIGRIYMRPWQVISDPNLEFIRNTPEFAAIVAETEAGIARPSPIRALKPEKKNARLDQPRG